MARAPSRSGRAATAASPSSPSSSIARSICERTDGVAQQPASLGDFRGKRIAIPGTLTTAYLALRLALPEFEPVVYPFDEILNVTAAGKVDAGLIIHEGQLTYQNQGLHLITDLGQWWLKETGLVLHSLHAPIFQSYGAGGVGESFSIAASDSARRQGAVHEAALAYGVKVSGCTVHFADNEYDHGPIILQRTVPVFDDDTPERLAARVFGQECEAYPEAIRLFAEGKLRIEGRRVRIAD